MGDVQGIRRRTEVASERVEQLSAKGSSALAAEQTETAARGQDSPLEKAHITLLCVNTELKRLLNDEPTIAEKNEDELHSSQTARKLAE